MLEVLIEDMLDVTLVLVSDTIVAEEGALDVMIVVVVLTVLLSVVLTVVDGNIVSVVDVIILKVAVSVVVEAALELVTETTVVFDVVLGVALLTAL